MDLGNKFIYFIWGTVVNNSIFLYSTELFVIGLFSDFDK